MLARARPSLSSQIQDCCGAAVATKSLDVVAQRMRIRAWHEKTGLEKARQGHVAKEQRVGRDEMKRLEPGQVRVADPEERAEEQAAILVLFSLLGSNMPSCEGLRCQRAGDAGDIRAARRR